MWISITRYSEAYGADRKTVHKWLASGLLEFYRVGRFIRIKHQPPKLICAAKSVNREVSPSQSRSHHPSQ